MRPRHRLKNPLKGDARRQKRLPSGSWPVASRGAGHGAKAHRLVKSSRRKRHGMAFFAFTDRKNREPQTLPAWGTQRSAPGSRQARATAAGSCCRRLWTRAAQSTAWMEGKENDESQTQLFFVDAACCLIHEKSLAPCCCLTHDECHQDRCGLVLAPTPDTWEVRGSSPLQEILLPAPRHPLPEHLWWGEDEEAAKKGAHPMSAHDPPEGDCRQCFEPPKGIRSPSPRLRMCFGVSGSSHTSARAESR